MVQEILVSIILAIALVGLGRYLYRNWKILKRDKKDAVCGDCPLKEKCNGKKPQSECSDTSCHCSFL